MSTRTLILIALIGAAIVVLLGSVAVGALPAPVLATVTTGQSLSGGSLR